jgi:hypothetical protein
MTTEKTETTETSAAVVAQGAAVASEKESSAPLSRIVASWFRPWIVDDHLGPVGEGRVERKVCSLDWLDNCSTVMRC